MTLTVVLKLRQNKTKVKIKFEKREKEKIACAKNNMDELTLITKKVGSNYSLLNHFLSADLAFATPNKVRPGEIAQLEFILQSSSESGEFDFGWEGFPKQKMRVLPSSVLTTARYSLWEKFLLKVKEIF